MQKQISKGILLRLVGVGLFAPIFAAGKIADGLYPALALVVMRYVGGFVTIWAYILIARVPLLKLKSPKPSRHFVRACLGVGGGAFVMHATTIMPVANATAIGLTEGIMIIVLAGLLLNETITTRHWIAGGIAVIGAGLVVWQSVDWTLKGLGEWEGVGAAFLGAIFITLEALLIKYLSSREDPLRMLLYVNGFGALVSLVLTLLLFDFAILASPGLLIFLSLGPLAIVAQYFNIKANTMANASTLAPISYSWIFFAVLMGYFMFDEVPKVITFVGIGLLIVGGVVISKART